MEINFKPLRICGLLLFLYVSTPVYGDYQIGLGRADCTGPPVEINFMGYGNLRQTGKGIHLRQFARAFVVRNESSVVAFVSVETSMVGYDIKREVLRRLADNYGDTFNNNNVIISATHTHSAPGGHMMHFFYDASIYGFVPQTFQALVDGIYLSIERAEKNMFTGKIYLSRVPVYDVSINRSPSSYLLNDNENRSLFEFDVDNNLTQLRFVDDGGNIRGAFNWFAIHPTSMDSTNTLVSSDNLGYASLLLEKEYNPNDVPGQGTFVGAFCSTNLGDVSPNIKGPKCSESGNPCDNLSSTCPENEGECIARGPGNDTFESTKIIGERLAAAALKLLTNTQGPDVNGREVVGELRCVHKFVDMPNYRYEFENETDAAPIDGVYFVNGCEPAMGYSFAAGTIDGPGIPLFQQGTTSDNNFVNILRDIVADPTAEDIVCQSPKPILLATGRATFPYEWQPKIVSTQECRIGNVILAAVPGEFTTMAGRNLQKLIEDFSIFGDGEFEVILAGLSNIYSSYITTRQEYQAQRYEAASTLYGPNTLSIYMNIYGTLTNDLFRPSTNTDSGEPEPEPPNMMDKVWSLDLGVLFDMHPLGRYYGHVKEQPLDNYAIDETVRVTFVAANPRNNLMHEKTYLAVEHMVGDDEWRVVYTDASWETKFIWERTSIIFHTSEVHIEWTITSNTKPGQYRIRHYGYFKPILGNIVAYEGFSNAFNVAGSPDYSD
ncbi:neutral ceramidase-like [Haematobia irritans]|uniref:neutral ceramidase-like n=1 Tax=Haematobia irritans TaxID=7368 RepID=UPI003F4FC50E